jgi:hypothetical protein
MRVSWINIGYRVAVLIIIYLLLSIPDSKYQSYSDSKLEEMNDAVYNDSLIIKHIPSILVMNKIKKTAIYDSLTSLINHKIKILRSEMIDSNSPVVDSLVYNFGLAAAIAGITKTDVKPLLESLWLWRLYIKEQSLFWNLNNDQQKRNIGSILNFISLCESFIVTNRNLYYSKFSGSAVALTKLPAKLPAKSGYLLVSSNDLSYPYLGLAKNIPDLKPSLGLIYTDGDSSFIISATPSEGLKINNAEDVLSKPLTSRLFLRFKEDLPEIISNPGLPHDAARFAYTLTISHDMGYDYIYNAHNHGALSEVELLRFALEGHNLNILIPFTHINDDYAFGLSRLGIGGKNLVSAGELQFHPSIEIVGLEMAGENIKRRNLGMAAVMAGLRFIDIPLTKSLRWDLPYYRLLKGISRIQNFFGSKPAIANGMAPEAAIIHGYIDSKREEILPLIIEASEKFVKRNHYFPTYSELTLLAKAIQEENVHKQKP